MDNNIPKPTTNTVDDDNFEHIEMPAGIGDDWQFILHRPRTARFAEAIAKMDIFVRDEANKGWVPPDELDALTFDAMTLYILDLCPNVDDNSRYDVVRLHSALEANYKLHACFACQDNDESNKSCNSVGSFVACMNCTSSGVPCGGLIRHPNDDLEFAIGFLPLSSPRADSFAEWASIEYWVNQPKLKSKIPVRRRRMARSGPIGPSPLRNEYHAI